MQYRTLGRSGLLVSPICLGTMMFGRQADGATAQRIVAHARDAGVNFVDTADVYNDGESERVLGSLLRDGRHDWVVATKVGNPMGPGPNRGGLGRKWMMAAIDASLGRLGMDHVDVWYLHRDDGTTPYEEVVATIGEVIAAGKVRYWGLSNFRAWQVADMAHLADRLGVPRPVAAQPLYNALNRMAETELIPACLHYGLGIVPYSPLARGVLTGKYLPGAAPDPGTRAGRADPRMMETEFRPESLEMAQALKRHAAARSLDPAHLAVLWLLNNRAVTSVLGGPRTFEQWPPYVEALAHGYLPEDEAAVDALVPAGHPSTPGYTDPRYPVAGRFPIVAGG